MDAGMQMKKWRSNLPQLNEAAKSSTEETPFLAKLEGDDKILGIIWHSSYDTFGFNPDPLIEFVRNTRPTKRLMLGALARLYDPPGFLAPVSMLLKRMLQDLHKLKAGLDQQLPIELEKRWNKWCGELEQLHRFSTARWLFNAPVEGSIKELHTFVDASESAYAAVVYILSEDSAGRKHCAFVGCKARIVPIKQLNLTIPKKELLAALCGARLATHVSNALEISNTQNTFWSDSKTVLSWIHVEVPEKLDIFLKNRVTEIRRLTNPARWRYILGVDNPADLPSRGMSVSKLLGQSIWLEGPQMLKEFEIDKGTPIVTHQALLKNRVQSPPDELVYFPIERFSTLQRAVRVTAFVMRAIKLFLDVRNVTHKRPIPKKGLSNICDVPPLLQPELHAAKQRLLAEAQKRCFGEGLMQLREGVAIDNPQLRSFHPFLDSVGIMRVGGRLEFLDEAFETKHPILLGKDHLTNLLIQDAHVRGCLHLRTDIVLNRLRQRYWILQARAAIKKVIFNCVVCKRMSASSAGAMEAPLPPERLQEFKAFANVGIDYIGPFQVKSEKRRVWGVLFSCCVTRAIYLDVVEDLTKHSFLLALKRFVATHGLLRSIVSDNATTFIGASRALKALWENLRSEDTQAYFGREGIRWTFNAPRASWWGGHFERLIRIIKSCLRKCMGKAILPIVDFVTLLKEIQGVINSRPLTRLPTSTAEPVALTPAHFLASQLPLALPPGTVVSGKKPEDLAKLWRLREGIIKSFWNRWRKEYILLLRAAHKRQDAAGEQLRVGDIVIVQEENVHRQYWRLGVIEELISGRDGNVRSYKLRTSCGVITRAAQHLYKLV